MASLIKRDSTFQVAICHDRRRYKLPGFGIDANGKRLTEELGRNVKKLLECKGSGSIPLDLRRYVETLPARIRRSMAAQGIIDAAAEGRPLIDHLAEYKRVLLGRGVTERHAAEVEATVAAAADWCSAKLLGQLKAGKVVEYLTARRTDIVAKGEDGTIITTRRGISARRFNGIIAALHSFYRWAMREGRVYENPVVNIRKLNQKTDVRHARRALDASDVRALIQAAEKGGELFGMTGRDRAMAYLIAATTGLRQNELRTLTWGCVDCERLTLKVMASYSKHRREDVLPIRLELAEALRSRRGKNRDSVRVFAMPDRFKMARAFHVDREAAAIAHRDDAGGVADYHALRHTFITSLVSGGVDPKTAQSLARHSTITLTMDRYTHTVAGADVAALGMLPDYSITKGTDTEHRGGKNGGNLGAIYVPGGITWDISTTIDSSHETLQIQGFSTEAARFERAIPFQECRFSRPVQ